MVNPSAGVPVPLTPPPRSPGAGTSTQASVVLVPSAVTVPEPTLPQSSSSVASPPSSSFVAGSPPPPSSSFVAGPPPPPSSSVVAGSPLMVASSSSAAASTTAGPPEVNRPVAEAESHDEDPTMKITALLVLKSPGDSSSSSSSGAAAGGEQQAVVLANASDVSHFGYLQRPAAREFILFVARTVALRTPAGRRQSVQHEEYKVHCYNQNGLCAIAFTDDHYPIRSAFSLLNMVLEEYQKTFGESWRTTKEDATQPWQYLNDALTKYQDPAEADKLLKIQRDLDETKIILHKTIDSVLARGERLDSLVEKSSDLSAASQDSMASAFRSLFRDISPCVVLVQQVGRIEYFCIGSVIQSEGESTFIVTQSSILNSYSTATLTVRFSDGRPQPASLISKNDFLCILRTKFHIKCKALELFEGEIDHTYAAAIAPASSCSVYNVPGFIIQKSIKASDDVPGIGRPQKHFFIFACRYGDSCPNGKSRLISGPVFNIGSKALGFVFKDLRCKHWPRRDDFGDIINLEEYLEEGFHLKICLASSHLDEMLGSMLGDDDWQKALRSLGHTG